MQIRTLPNGDIEVTCQRHSTLRRTLHAVQSHFNEAAAVHERMASLENESDGPGTADAVIDHLAEADYLLERAIRFSRHEIALGTSRA